MVSLIFFLLGLIFSGIVFFAFKKGDIAPGASGISFRKNDNPLGFYFTVIMFIWIACVCFYGAFKAST